MAKKPKNLVSMSSYDRVNCKLCLEQVWEDFGIIWPFFSNFLFFTENPWFFRIFFENSKKALFDLWDRLWWVFHMFLALNHWFKPNNEGWKKSVPKMFKTAVTVVLKYCNYFLSNSKSSFLHSDSKMGAKHSYPHTTILKWSLKIWYVHKLAKFRQECVLHWKIFKNIHISFS